MSTICVDLLGAEAKYYDAAGIRTRSIEAGSGDALILLPGSAGHAEAYAQNVIPPSERFQTCSVDMVGHGLTDKPEGDYQRSEFNPSDAYYDREARPRADARLKVGRAK